MRLASPNPCCGPMASSVRKITRVHTLDGVKLPEAGALHAELNALYESEYA